MSRDKRPLECALCGMPLWNDPDSVVWLPFEGDDRKPYCADKEQGCADLVARMPELIGELP